MDDILADLPTKTRHAVWTALHLHYDQRLVLEKAIVIGSRRHKAPQGHVAQSVFRATGQFPGRRPRRGKREPGRESTAPPTPRTRKTDELATAEFREAIKTFLQDE